MIMEMVETQGGMGLELYGELMTTRRTNLDLHAGRKRLRKEADDLYEPINKNIPGWGSRLPL